jgi:transcriptional regulator with XRE-family HTH domain
MTQEQAAELLNVSPRTLSDYENGHANVPDVTVAAMCKEYNTPLLAWWHLKHTSVLCEFLPDVIMPKTDGDMTAQICLAESKLNKVANEIREIMFDGKVDGDEQLDFQSAMEIVKQINAKLFSVLVYAGSDK